MNPYNDFTSAERTRALRWLNIEYAAGRRTRPTSCEVCQQTEGVIEAHSENYSFPYGPHIGAHSLCYRCHMMIHCRFKNPKAWAAYRTQMRNGVTFAPMLSRSFPRFTSETLTRFGQGVPHTRGPARGPTFLDTLH